MHCSPSCRARLTRWKRASSPSARCTAASDTTSLQTRCASFAAPAVTRRQLKNVAARTQSSVHRSACQGSALTHPMPHAHARAGDSDGHDARVPARGAGESERQAGRGRRSRGACARVGVCATTPPARGAPPPPILTIIALHSTGDDPAPHGRGVLRRRELFRRQRAAGLHARLPADDQRVPRGGGDAAGGGRRRRRRGAQTRAHEDDGRGGLFVLPAGAPGRRRGWWLGGARVPFLVCTCVFSHTFRAPLLPYTRRAPAAFSLSAARAPARCVPAPHYSAARIARVASPQRMRPRHPP